MTKSVTYDDVRQFLGASTMIASPLGGQLDRLRDGTSGGVPDHRILQSNEEARRLWDAQIIRCVDGLARLTSVRWAWAPKLRAIARRTGMPEGELVVRVLRIYEPWDPQWPMHGLASVYEWLRTIGPFLRAIDRGNEESDAQALRVGQSRRARALAQSVVADAHVCLGEWVRIWTNRHDPRRSAA